MLSTWTKKVANMLKISRRGTRRSKTFWPIGMKIPLLVRSRAPIQAAFSILFSRRGTTTGRISHNLSSTRKKMSISNWATFFRRIPRVKLVLYSSHRFKRHQLLQSQNKKRSRCLDCPFLRPHRLSTKRRSLSPQTLNCPISLKPDLFPTLRTSPTSSRHTLRLFTMSSLRVRRKAISRSYKISRSN